MKPDFNPTLPENSFTYCHARLKSYDYSDYPYGYPISKQCSVHPEGDNFVISWWGQKIAEVRADKTVTLHFGKGLSPGVKARWAQMLSYRDIISTTRRSVTGKKSYTLKFLALEPTDKKDKWGQNQFGPVEKGSVNASTCVRINVSKFPFTFEAVDPVVTVEKDKEKYADFNKGLKKLKAVLTAQTKLGSYDALLKMPSWDLREHTRKVLQTEKDYKYLTWLEVRNHLYKNVLAWMEDPNVDKLRLIATLCFTNHTSEFDRNDQKFREGGKRRIASGLTTIQQEFLRRECLTIEESNNSLTPNDESDDQNRELLPSAGLREVQVPSEAQVC